MTLTRPAGPAADLDPHRPPRRGRPGWPVSVALGLALALGVAFRLHSASALWLDEALSVNIARLPLAQLPQALREDGSPPLYYLLLHGWIALFGAGTTAVRSLSVLFGIAAIPLTWWAGRRLRDAVTGWSAALLLAASPFAVRYSSETRMYSLVLVLTLLGIVALQAALQRPTRGRLAAVAALSGLLLLTHYWALYLLAVTGATLLVMAWRGRRRAAAGRCAAALAAGWVVFLPWLPSFIFQARHTGTPWVKPPESTAVLDTITTWSGGRTLAGSVLALGLLTLVVVAVLGRTRPDGLLIGRRVAPLAGLLTLISLGTLLLGIVLGALTSAGYSPRYSSVALGPFLLAVALGVQVFSPRSRQIVLAVAVVLGLLGSVYVPFTHRRTQAAKIARLIRPGLAAGDLVVYCPDQNGPAVNRLLPPSTDQVVYPTLGRPERVDWRDYAQRNDKASPTAFARRVLSRSRGALWLVSSTGHLTFGSQCEDLATALAAARGTGAVLLTERYSYGEHEKLTRYPPARG